MPGNRRLLPVCRCLEDERTAVLNERDELVSQLEATRREMGSKVGQLQAEQERLFSTCQELQVNARMLEPLYALLVSLVYKGLTMYSHVI